MRTLIFLDDLRNPSEQEWVDWLSQNSPIPAPYEVVWIKSFEVFSGWIKQNGIPEGVCFDFDLGSDVAREKVKRGMSKRQARKERKGTKSGFDCATFLIKYCRDNNLALPPYEIQSANEEGKEQIDSLLKSFNNI